MPAKKCRKIIPRLGEKRTDLEMKQVQGKLVYFFVVVDEKIDTLVRQRDYQDGVRKKVIDEEKGGKVIKLCTKCK